MGLSVLRGRMTAAQLSAVADLATRYGNGQLRTTVMQNLLVVNVPAEQSPGASPGTRGPRLAGRRLRVLERRDCLHRQRVLQAGDHRDQGLYALDCR